MTSHAAAAPSSASTTSWRSTLGSTWRWQIAFVALCLFAFGAAAPLADPDLPIHLATGEWIVRHHAVPFTELWAWTRAGQPYYAYSWAVETVYYLVLAYAGPLGLHAVQGITTVALAASIALLGWAAGWRAWTTIAVALIHVLVASSVVPFLRPQSILLIVTPCIWALVLRARDATALRWELPVLMALSALAANSHLLFPVTAAPCVLLLVQPPTDRKRWLLIPGAIIVGWLLTPYALHWQDVFALNFAPNALNFAPNAMSGPPSPIAEFRPGFSAAVASGMSSLLLCCGLALVPWAVAARSRPVERLVYGALWIAGLVLFALSLRGLAVWWLLIIPTAALAIEALPVPTLPALITAQRAAVLIIFPMLTLSVIDQARDPRVHDGTVITRRLPSISARSMEPIAEWLDCNVQRTVPSRLITTFNYGSYIAWRLPYLSESIDGRTIFADSVARSETYLPPNRPAINYPPWRTADLAIVPFSVPLAAVLDTATGWRRVAITSQLDGKPTMIGLWVTRSWWSRAGLSPIPSYTVPLYHTLTPATACARPDSTSGVGGRETP